ncbi:hypothetical protein [Aurantiacibacter rhizosphaerae]|uniref:Uncharacterized protein n=1 Tax=Aurantiacibacter rhizosphaerae TaxID=2691582 RepID=A0A844XEL2_9SPHN|nr:hypothetical protein [Aurantiacibacter rhizosphaerae]MWV28917.1 hypothetical protein [Aurantiacibacter rhizosphaerae]
MKNFAKIVTTIALAGFATPAMAQLEPYTDYTVSDSVSSVTTVKVNANMMDHYLEGLRKTWVTTNEMSKEMGHIESYAIYVSDLPASGDFNLLLVVRFANTADLAPNKARYEAFMREWGEANKLENEEITATVYPDLREITGEYLLRELRMKPE